MDESLKHKLLRFLEEYAAWSRPVDEYIQSNFNRINQEGGDTFERLHQECQAMRAEMLVRDNPFARFGQLMENVCRQYASSGASARQAIRTFFAGHRELCDLARDYAMQTARQLTPENAQSRLPVALAALSIENGRADMRDTLVAMTDVWMLAREAGADPRMHFEAAAGLADASSSDGGVSMSRLFSTFERHPVLLERLEQRRC